MALSFISLVMESSSVFHNEAFDRFPKPLVILRETCFTALVAPLALRFQITMIDPSRALVYPVDTFIAVMAVISYLIGTCITIYTWSQFDYVTNVFDGWTKFRLIAQQFTAGILGCSMTYEAYTTVATRDDDVPEEEIAIEKTPTPEIEEKPVVDSWWRKRPSTPPPVVKEEPKPKHVKHKKRAKPLPKSGPKDVHISHYPHARPYEVVLYPDVSDSPPRPTDRNIEKFTRDVRRAGGSPDASEKKNESFWSRKRAERPETNLSDESSTSNASQQNPSSSKSNKSLTSTASQQNPSSSKPDKPHKKKKK